MAQKHFINQTQGGLRMRTYYTNTKTKSSPLSLVIARNKLGECHTNLPNQLEHLLFERSWRNIKSKMRSERRAAIHAVSRYVIDNTDLYSLKFGQYNYHTGNIKPVSLRMIAKYIGLHPRRVQRAMMDLSRAGYFVLEPRFIASKNGPRALNPIRKINPKFFYHLGVSHKIFNNDRLYAKKRYESMNRQSKRKSQYFMRKNSVDIKNLTKSKTTAPVQSKLNKESRMKHANHRLMTLLKENRSVFDKIVAYRNSNPSESLPDIIDKFT